MAIMKKMLFIINPRSGKEQIRSRLLEILDSFVKAGYGPSVYITQGPKDAEYQAARAKTKELVVCSGGDGTLNEVVSGLMTITPEKRPELGYIPSGTSEKYAESGADSCAGKAISGGCRCIRQKPIFRLCGGVRSIYGGILFDPAGDEKYFGASGIYAGSYQTPDRA